MKSIEKLICYKRGILNSVSSSNQNNNLFSLASERANKEIQLHRRIKSKCIERECKWKSIHEYRNMGSIKGKIERLLIVLMDPHLHEISSHIYH